MAKINILALGGLDEKTKSLYVLEIDSKIFIIDAGIYEPLRDDYGVQYVIPKLDYLKENADKVKALFLSTGNKQQIGATGQLIKEFPKLKIFGSDVAMKSLELLFPDAATWDLNILVPGKEQEIFNTKVNAIEMAASMPGTFGYEFKSSDGNILYLTDYIFDVIEEFNTKTSLVDFYKFSDHNTLLLMSDSLNSSIESSISPKYKIKKYIENTFIDLDRRMVASVYEDEIINIVELLRLAKDYKKQVFFYDERQFKLLKFLMEKNYIENFNIKMFDDDNSNTNSVVIITGTRTDLYSKLQHIIIAEQGLKLDENDVIFLASPPQPGNEHIYAEIANDMARFEPTIIEVDRKEKFSIHPSQFDLKNFLLLVRPKYFMPIKGYYKEMLKAKEVAITSGIDEKNIIMAENGEIFSIENKVSNGIARKLKEVGSTNIQLATDSGIEMDVIKDRETLGSEGLATIGFMIDKKTKELRSNIDVQMRGVVFIKGQDDLLKEINNKIIEIIDSSKNEWIMNQVKSKINKEVGKMIKTSIKKTPYLVINIQEI